MQIHIRAISVLRPSHKMAKSYYFFVVLKLKIRTGAYGDLASEIHTWGRILTNLYFECLELDLNCNQLGASAPQKNSLQTTRGRLNHLPPTYAPDGATSFCHIVWCESTLSPSERKYFRSLNKCLVQEYSFSFTESAIDNVIKCF